MVSISLLSPFSMFIVDVKSQNRHIALYQIISKSSSTVYSWCKFWFVDTLQQLAKVYFSYWHVSFDLSFRRTMCHVWKINLVLLAAAKNLTQNIDLDNLSYSSNSGQDVCVYEWCTAVWWTMTSRSSLRHLAGVWVVTFIFLMKLFCISRGSDWNSDVV
jgi:hypothetical protein